MKFECKDLDRCLEIPELLADAREHARDCAACRRALWVWGELPNAARSLRQEWDTPQLWGRIRAQLEAEPKRKVARRWDWRAVLAVAAVAVVAAGSVVVYEARRPAAQPATTAVQGDFLTEQTLNEVEQAEAAYRRSIEKLSKLAQPKLESSDTALLTAYREKILLLDSAIEDLRASIKQNRFNTRLQMELAALYKQKQETLQEIVGREHKN